MFIPPFHTKIMNSLGEAHNFLNINMKAYKKGAQAPDLSAYEALFDETGISNPYAQINQADYKNNKRGRMQYQEDLAEAQYLAEMQLMMYQNEYNSPSAQAERQRLAGINPDLAGVSGESAASPAGNVKSPDFSGIPTAGETALGIVDTTLSLMGSLAQGVVGVAGAIRNVEGKELENMGKVFGAVPGIGDALGGIFGESGAYNSSPDGFKATVREFTRHAPRKYRRSLEKYLTHYMGTPQYMRGIYDSQSSVAESRGRYAKTQVDPRTKGDIDDIMNAMRPMQEAEFEVAKLLLSEQKSKSQKMSDYWNERDMSGRASAENAEDQASKGEANIQEIVRKGALKTVGYLEKAMKEGKWWASTALSALYASLSGAMKMPSLGFSSQNSSSVDPKTGNVQNSSNSAWNFGF